MAVTTLRFISMLNYGVLVVKIRKKSTEIVTVKSLNR